MGLGSGIRDPGKTYPGSHTSCQTGAGSRIRNTEPAYFLVTRPKFRRGGNTVPGVVGQELRMRGASDRRAPTGRARRGRRGQGPAADRSGSTRCRYLGIE
jgi:hypothetical protein